MNPLRIIPFLLVPLAVLGHPTRNGTGHRLADMTPYADGVAVPDADLLWLETATPDGLGHYQRSLSWAELEAHFLGAYQPLDADLTIYAGITPSTNVQSILGAASYSAIKALMDLESGIDFYSTIAADNAFQPKEATLTDIADGTIAEDLVNTANPWADNEVSDTITVGVSGSVNDAAIPAGVTRDTEWDTFAEINAASTDTDAVLDTDIGATVQAYDVDLDDLADGSLTGSKVGTGIDAANVTTGFLPSGVTRIFTEQHATTHTLTASECYGSVYYITASGVTLTLPPVANGMSITIICTTANVGIVDADPSDLIILDGTALDDGDSIDSPGAAGDIVTLTYYDATGWWAVSNTWTDGGVS